MPDISQLMITDEKWASMSEEEHLVAIHEGNLTDEQMTKIREGDSDAEKAALTQYLADHRTANLGKKVYDQLQAQSEEWDRMNARFATEILRPKFDLPQLDWSLLASAEREEFRATQQEISGELDDLLAINRRGVFDRDLTERTAASERLGEPLALVMIDLDKFKSINDSHGHPAGDEVLQSVAGFVRGVVGAKGRCYRYGGEEITVLLSNYSADEAAALAERIRRQIEASPIGSKALSVTASFGVAEVPMHATIAADLLKMADAACYEAKDLGRNLVRIHGEPRPSARGPRVTLRREPDPNGLTETEAVKIRTEYFSHRPVLCPRDGSVLRTREFESDEQRTPDLIITFPLCGLSEKLPGLW